MKYFEVSQSIKGAFDRRAFNKQPKCFRSFLAAADTFSAVPCCFGGRTRQKQGPNASRSEKQPNTEKKTGAASIKRKLLLMNKRIYREFI
jgi:hypothetical protein